LVLHHQLDRAQLQQRGPAGQQVKISVPGSSRPKLKPELWLIRWRTVTGLCPGSVSSTCVARA
ncbi:MAG TPA: hypothetical protein VGP61_03780, partial [Gemmatimonadales bacterium]|nr:hypothetical protein [Gemmatimonadales bacterium]